MHAFARFNVAVVVVVFLFGSLFREFQLNSTVGGSTVGKCHSVIIAKVQEQFQVLVYLYSVCFEMDKRAG